MWPHGTQLSGSKLNDFLCWVLLSSVPIIAKSTGHITPFPGLFQKGVNSLPDHTCAGSFQKGTQSLLNYTCETCLPDESPTHPGSRQLHAQRAHPQRANTAWRPFTLHANVCVPGDEAQTWALTRGERAGVFEEGPCKKALFRSAFSSFSFTVIFCHGGM